MTERKTKSKVYPEYYEYPIPFDPSVGIDAFSEVERAPEVDDFDDEFKESNCFKNNTKLLAAGVKLVYTPEQMAEFKKCLDNIFYFIINYAKVITLKDGVQLLKLFQYQKNAIKIIAENRFSIFKFPRQMGKCVKGSTKVRVKINGSILNLTIEELYNMFEIENTVESYTPNYDYDILTEEGFKNFDGITTRETNELLKITLDDQTIIKVTPSHDVKLYHSDFVKASELKIGDNLGSNDKKTTITHIEKLSGKYKVADMISVQDTSSFVVNDMSAILSNCIDGESMITLFDNHTKEIFTIHISELYDYLLEGSK
jgi:hypothetical protein